MKWLAIACVLFALAFVLVAVVLAVAQMVATGRHRRRTRQRREARGGIIASPGCGVPDFGNEPAGITKPRRRATRSLW